MRDYRFLLFVFINKEFIAQDARSFQLFWDTLLPHVTTSSPEMMKFRYGFVPDSAPYPSTCRWARRKRLLHRSRLLTRLLSSMEFSRKTFIGWYWYQLARLAAVSIDIIWIFLLAQGVSAFVCASEKFPHFQTTWACCSARFGPGCWVAKRCAF